MIEQLIHYKNKPALYEPGTAFMWTDAHISKQLLQVHLNSDVDLASRRTSTIERTVDWMLHQTSGAQMDILDLGCGPGLYAERLAQKGHRVTGMDISAESIQYAQKNAASSALEISYRNGDYLSLDDENKFDLAILIYTDLGVLLPDDRQKVIENVHRALKPGGLFIFDVLNVHRFNEKQTPKNWEISESGFWRNHPYLALSESWSYPDDNVILYQHIVSDKKGVDVYRFWTHLFSDVAIKALVTSSGFSTCECHTDVLPAQDAWSGDNVTFCVAQK